jgi:hypothetical protein
MAPRIARGQYNLSQCLLLLVALFALLPSPAAAQARDWAVTYDGGGPDWLGCTYCSHPWQGSVPEPVRSARAVTADTAGNSWITGGTFNGTNYDVVTVKYDAQGVRQWAVVYDGGEEDAAAAVAVDAAGNVYVGGLTYRQIWEYDAIQPHALLLKYDASGTLLWERVYRSGVQSQGLALAVDAAGNSYLGVQNYGDDDLVWAELRKISPAGAYLGSDYHSFGFDYNEMGPRAVTLDAAGNAYLAGWLYKPFEPDQMDYFVLKFGGWAARYDSGAQDDAYDLAVDGAGRVFVTGNRGTAAFSSAGAPLWSAPFSGTPYAVVARDGGVWVTGTDAQNFRTARYDAATGAASWSVTSGGPAADTAYALRSMGGVVYVAGTSSNGTNNDVLTVGLDAATGAEVWQDRYDQSGNERAPAMAAAGNGFWVAGTTDTADGDLLNIRYELAEAGPAVSALTLSPATFPGGCQSSSGRVTLSAPAPAGGTVVALASTNPVAVIPASITVPAGQTRATFPITAPAVSSLQTGTVTATAGGQSRSATLRVRPIGVLSLVLGPNPVTGPNRVDGSVLLECAAAPGPITVQLTSSNQTVAWPNVSSIVIPAGAATGRFTVSTADVDVTRYVTIKAATGGTSKTVSLEVR